MYNAEKPTEDELPSTARLIRSTIIALVAAVLILVTIVLPAEYGIDPTGVGRALGLAEMGEIKVQLAEEAEEDRLRELDQSSFLDGLLSLIFTPAYAHDDGSHEDAEYYGAPVNEEVSLIDAAPEWTDMITLMLEPGQGMEVKLVMEEGASARYLWETEGGVVNYDLHGDGSGNQISYQRDRGVPGDEGTLVAAFTGNHGWFWRNRDRQTVTVTLYVSGDYSEVIEYR